MFAAPKISVLLKSAFLDSAKIQRAADAGTRKVLGWFGGYVRKVAQHSIHKRKAISQPGQPPSSHEGSLKNMIRYAVDMGRQSVVIGPESKSAGSRVPALLEHGGTVLLSLRRRGFKKQARYRPRPFMGPAFAKSMPALPAMWAKSVK